MVNNSKVMCRIYCELIILSKNLSPDEISKITQIEPFRFFNKGDIFQSKKSGTKGERQYSLWAIQSNISISEELDLSSHFSFFKSIFDDKVEIIQNLKNDTSTEISFWIWIETNETGVGLDILDADMLFMNNISNSVHFSILTNETLVSHRLNVQG